MRRPILGLAVVVAAAIAAPAAHAQGVPEYFPLPAGEKLAGGIDVAPDGTVYFGAGDGFEPTPPIGRLNSALAVPGTSNGMTFVDTADGPGCCASIFRDVAWSTQDQRLYWTRSDSLVGTLVGDTAASTVISAGPWSIVAAPDTGAWFTEYTSSNVPPYNGNRIAKVAKDLGVTEHVNIAMQTGSWDGNRYDTKPRGISVDSAGIPWFVESDPGNPGYRIARSNGSNGYVEYRPCPTMALCSGSFTGTGLTDTAIADDGAVWYTNDIKKSIGRFVPADATYEEFPLANIGTGLGSGTPRAIRKGPDGALWLAVSGGFSNPGANAIVKLVPSVPPAATVYKLGAAQEPFDLAPDSRGNVWFGGSAGTGGAPLGRLKLVPDPAGPPPPPPPPPTTVVGTGTAKATLTDPTVKGTTMKVNQICVGPPQDKCSLVYLIDTNEYVTGFPGSKGLAAAAAKPKKRTTIGKLTVTLNGGQSKKVTIKLNSKGKKLLKKIKKFKARLTITQTVTGQKKPKTILKKNVSFRK